MNNQLAVFNFKDQEVRTVMVEGEPWWVAKDVCEVLGLSHVTESLKRLRPKERHAVELHTPGGLQEMIVISESGLYKLIMRSRKKEAEQFQDWVTEEVLPSIRKTGSYVAPSVDPMAAISILTQNTNQLSLAVGQMLPALHGSVMEIKTEQIELTNRLSAVEQHQKDHDAKVIDAYRQGLHRCKELLVFGTKGKPQAITWQSYWRELKEVCKVSSFDLRNQAALSVPIMKKAFEYAQEWCKTRGVNPPGLFDFMPPEKTDAQQSGSERRAG